MPVIGYVIVTVIVVKWVFYALLINWARKR